MKCTGVVLRMSHLVVLVLLRVDRNGTASVKVDSIPRSGVNAGFHDDQVPVTEASLSWSEDGEYVVAQANVAVLLVGSHTRLTNVACVPMEVIFEH